MFSQQEAGGFSSRSHFLELYEAFQSEIKNAWLSLKAIWKGRWRFGAMNVWWAQMACGVTQLLRARWAFSGGQSAAWTELEQWRATGHTRGRQTKSWPTRSKIYFCYKVMLHFFCSLSKFTLRSSLFTSYNILIFFLLKSWGSMPRHA